MKRPTDYEQFEAASVQNRRLLREEDLILEATIAMCEAVKREGLTRAALAGRLGRTPGYVTQLLSGGRNLTLRTLADVADALGSKVRIKICQSDLKARVVPPFSVVQTAAWEIPDFEFRAVADPQIRIPDPMVAVRAVDEMEEQELVA